MYINIKTPHSQVFVAALDFQTFLSSDLSVWKGGRPPS